MLSALMHNMSWLRVSELRRRDIVAELSESETRQAQIGAESIHHFDGLVGISSLGSRIPVLSAQVDILQRDFSRALKLLDANFEGFIKQALGRLECVLHADAAWCHLRLGEIDDAKRQAQAALSLINPGTHIDDRAMTYGRLARIFGELEEQAIANSCQLNAESARRALRLQQEQLVTRLQLSLSSLHLDNDPHPS